MDKEIQEGARLAWLSYIGILFLVPLLAMKDNKFAQFHAKQGMVLLFYWVAWSIASMVLGAILFFVILFIALAGGFFALGFGVLFWIIWVTGWIVLLIFALVGLIQSLMGKYWHCPLGVYTISQKFKF